MNLFSIFDGHISKHIPLIAEVQGLLQILELPKMYEIEEKSSPEIQLESLPKALTILSKLNCFRAIVESFLHIEKEIISRLN